MSEHIIDRLIDVAVVIIWFGFLLLFFHGWPGKGKD